MPSIPGWKQIFDDPQMQEYLTGRIIMAIVVMVLMGVSFAVGRWYGQWEADNPAGPPIIRYHE